MFKRFVLLFVFVVEVMSAMESGGRFEKIIEDNLESPEQIVSNLVQWKQERGGDFPAVAQAFLSNFGGENFEEEKKNAASKYRGSEEEQELKEIALRIGSALRKSSTNAMGDLEKLRAARRFLGFYYDGGSACKKSHAFFDNDVSSSFVLDQLNDMIATREAYVKSFEELQKSFEHTSDDRSKVNVTLSSSLSDDSQ